MRNHHIRLFAAAFALVALAASGCGGTVPALTQPTTAPIPPTATTVPATATVLPPTERSDATVAPSGSSSSSSGFLGPALDKVKSATVYRVDLQITGQGNFGLNSGETPSPDSITPTPANQQVTLISMKGEVNGQSSHFTLAGLVSSFLGIDPGKSLEVVATPDKNYIHGPVGIIGATEDKWYELPAGESSVAKPPVTTTSFLNSFTASGLDPNDFKKAGTEALDNHSCDVYSGDKSAVEKTFKTVGQAAGAGYLSSIDTAELKFWICDDGLMHQVRMAVQGHVQDQPDQKGSFLMQMHIYDFGANIQISVPSNAEPLTMPSSINPGTPTP